MTEYDISNYTYQQLKNAFKTVDDFAYPDRAIMLYQRIKEFEEMRLAESQKVSQNVQNPGILKTIILTIVSTLLYPFLLRSQLSGTGPVGWIEREESIIQEKIQRIEALIQKEESCQKSQETEI